jgi:hypothetical protein
MKLRCVRYVSQLEAAFADYGAPKAYNDYPVLRPRRRLVVVGPRLLFLELTRRVAAGRSQVSPSFSSVLQARDIDDKSIFHIPFQHSFVGFINLLDRNNFYV